MSVPHNFEKFDIPNLPTARDTYLHRVESKAVPRHVIVYGDTKLLAAKREFTGSSHRLAI